MNSKLLSPLQGAISKLKTQNCVLAGTSPDYAGERITLHIIHLRGHFEEGTWRGNERERSKGNGDGLALREKTSAPLQ